jgi:predicted lipoprotein with Yx(FWY)xxD motif
MKDNMKNKLFFSTILMLAALLAACAPQAAPTTAPTTPTSPPVADTQTPVIPNTGSTSSVSSDTVMVADNPTLGSILVDSNGMTLYLFLKDNGTTTACTGICAQNWPALTSASPNAGSGADAALLRTVPDTNQVTYNGHLLYTFVKDKSPGDVNGEGLQNAWYAVSPTGEAVQPAGASASPTQSGNGY